jgi:hypothetical protein
MCALDLIRGRFPRRRPKAMISPITGVEVRSSRFVTPFGRSPMAFRDRHFRRTTRRERYAVLVLLFVGSALTTGLIESSRSPSLQSISLLDAVRLSEKSPSGCITVRLPRGWGRICSSSSEGLGVDAFMRTSPSGAMSVDPSSLNPGGLDGWTFVAWWGVVVAGMLLRLRLATWRSTSRNLPKIPSESTEITDTNGQRVTTLSPFEDGPTYERF